jgi:hypothetical protein
VYRLTTTGETSEYFKKILLRDVFIMPFRTMESQQKISLSLKNTASWSLKEPLEEMNRFIWQGTSSSVFMGSIYLRS